MDCAVYATLPHRLPTTYLILAASSSLRSDGWPPVWATCNTCTRRLLHFLDYTTTLHYVLPRFDFTLPTSHARWELSCRIRPTAAVTCCDFDLERLLWTLITTSAPALRVTNDLCLSANDFDRRVVSGSSNLHIA